MSSQAANTSGMGARHPVIAGAETAWDMLHEEETSKHITTSCEDLDTILGGGIHCKQVTEIGGVPGIGKTQLGIQLAVNVQIPVRFGGLGGKAIYIDTEGSFMAERAFQIAEACVNETLYGGVVHGKDCQVHANAFLSNIFYFRVCSYTEQIAVVNHLDKFIGDQDNVKIVIMDSVTFHFRQGFEDLALRTRILGGLSLKLMKLAKEHNLAVVLLNQVTSKFTNGSFQLTLALGESWSHCCTTRLILYWKGNERFAFLDKSSSLPAASAPYFISSKGIRNAPSPCKRIKVL